MAQYTLGSVLLFKDSSTIYGSEATDWSGVDAICIFSVAGAYFQLASPSSQIAMTSFVGYDQAATYSRGDLARHGGKYYVARRSTVGEVPTINSQAWMPTSRWSLTLNAPCPLDDQAALYAIHKDFTPNLSLPLVRPTDRNAIALLGRAMMQLDTYSGQDAPTEAIEQHNSATDSHADIRADLAGKQPSLTISPVGTALLNLSTPTAVKIPRINADGSVTLIDVPSGGGGSSITEVTPVWPIVITTHTFEAFGDSNGLIYAATGLGQPVVLSTSGSVGGGSLGDLIDHAADDIYLGGDVGTWLQVDFGEGRGVSPDYFTIRNNYNNHDPLRNWEWRGSNDLSTWDVLDARINDTTLDASSVWGGWEPNTGTGQYFRYIRLVRTGPTGGGGAGYIRIGELEMYGSYAVGEIHALPSWATVWLSDGTHIWPGRPL